MSQLPNDFIKSPNVGGTNEAANNKFTSGTEPETGVNTIMPFAKASGTKGAVNDSVLDNKATVIGGTSMGK